MRRDERTAFSMPTSPLNRSPPPTTNNRYVGQVEKQLSVVRPWNSSQITNTTTTQWYVPYFCIFFCCASGTQDPPVRCLYTLLFVFLPCLLSSDPMRVLGREAYVTNNNNDNEQQEPPPPPPPKKGRLRGCVLEVNVLFCPLASACGCFFLLHV